MPTKLKKLRSITAQESHGLDVIDNQIEEESEIQPEEYSSEEKLLIEAMRNQVKILHEGFAVNVIDVVRCEDRESHIVLKVTLNSNVNRMPVFGDVRIRFAKQAIRKLQSELAKVS